MADSHKALPPGAQSWGRSVDDALAKLAQVEAITRRLCNDFGLDFSNPTRGLGSGSTPSVNNPVQLKLPSLQDLDIRDAQDGDLLTFDGKTGKWVARRHNTVQVPKETVVGDPDSYYVEPVEEVSGLVLADTWSAVETVTNFATDPTLGSTTTGMLATPAWAVIDTAFEYSSKDIVGITSQNSVTRSGGGATQIGLNFTRLDSNGSNGISLSGLPPETTIFQAYVTMRDLVIPAGADQPDLEPYIWANLTHYDADGAATYMTVYAARYLPHDMSDWATLAPYQQNFYYYSSNPPVSATLTLEMTLPWRNSSANIYLDDLMLLDKTEPYSGEFFYGGSPDTYEIDYTYGAGGVSLATPKQRVKIPATVPAGREMQILGEGFAPGDLVWIEAYAAGHGEYYNPSVTADASCNFETSITIAETDAPGNAYFYAYSDTSSLRYTPEMTFTIAPAE